MEKDDMKNCPYCAEMIKKEAIKCRYCGSMLTKKDIKFDFLSTPGYWHRVNEGKKVAGVCTGIAKQLDSLILILPLRLFFILTTVFYGFGIILYIVLWILMAAPTDLSSGGNGIVQKEGGKPSKGEEPSEDTVKENTPETEEAVSGEEPEKNDAKMSSLPRNTGIFTVMIFALLIGYFFVLVNIFDVAVSPLFLLSGFIVAVIPLTVTVFALYYKRNHTLTA